MSASVVPPDHVATHSETPTDDSGGQKQITGRSPMRIALGRLLRDKIAVLCAVVVLMFVLVAIFAGVICDILGVNTEVGDPATQLNVLTGLPLEGPPNGGFDPDHPFGIAPRTAKDNLASWVYGCRTSLLVAALATAIASVIGIVTGLLAGYLGGVVDRVVGFLTDFFLTIPYLLAALSVAPILNERFAGDPDTYATVQVWSLVTVLVMFGWMGTSRLIRGEVLSLREREFVQSARVVGMPTSRIMIREMLPNLAAPIVISTSLMLPAFVAAEAGLAYLGIGITTGESWGQTINDAAKVSYFEDYPLYLWQPLLGVVALVLALNLLGDAIRDALDPKTRR